MYARNPPRLANPVSLTGHTREVSPGENLARVGDAPGGAGLAVLSGHEDKVHAVAASPHGRRALSGAKDRRLRLWDLEAGREVSREPTSGAVLLLAVRPDGRRMAAGTDDRKVLVFDLVGGV